MDEIKVLVVDDDAIERKSIHRELTLNSNNYKVVEACTAEEAFVYIDNISFDVIFIDYHMPRVNGIEAIIRLRNISHLKHTAIVMISNNSDEQLMLDCINAGAQDFLLKSDISESQLARTIVQSRKRHELELQLYDSYQKVKQLAERDKLTGIHNRYYFEEALEQVLHNQQRYPEELTAVMLFDLDKFKHINDTFGHETGDRLLINVVERLKQTLRGDELFARLGGDEFVLACSNISSVRQIKSIVKRTLKQFDKPFVVDGHSLYCACSVGVAISPVNGDSREELLKLADIAMYRAKKSSQMQFCLFEDNMQESFLRNYKIESELRKAIDKQDFTLNYQPIINMSSGDIVGVEALIRWPNATTSNRPDEFIPVAEEAGLINSLGRWVLKEVFSFLHHLHCLSHTGIYASINVSPCQLSDKNFVANVRLLLRSYPHLSSSLVFEITETALLSNDQTTTNTLIELHDLGIKIALDDFGTGYSSLSHLLSFPIDIVKIDKSIIQNLTKTETSHSYMFDGLTYMLRKLHINAIAEGVETNEQALFCEQNGVKLIQGYLFYRPFEGNQLIGLLNKSLRQNTGMLPP